MSGMTHFVSSSARRFDDAQEAMRQDERNPGEVTRRSEAREQDDDDREGNAGNAEVLLPLPVVAQATIPRRITTIFLGSMRSGGWEGAKSL